MIAPINEPCEDVAPHWQHTSPHALASNQLLTYLRDFPGASRHRDGFPAKFTFPPAVDLKRVGIEPVKGLGSHWPI